ncbi:tyrosine-type recombinase/integrase [Paradevosia shaoguanensis]|uniref:tyrosine-type recombinase/integrase n=1 Tax=Paradevosia shaoguanensis TaxID=1335043 RepID=UPI001934AF16|nr:site-specific integrase [Paradevosia shaoguanensis]
MSVRKRTWSTKGVEHSGWQADYVDAQGKRRRKMFDRKKDADAFLLTAKSEVREGVHVADADTITIAEAGKLWLKSGAAAGLERSSLEQREQHLRLHIVPFAGATRLNKLTAPWLRAFQDELREAGRSADMVRRVTVSLGSIIADAQSRGLTVRNPVHERGRARSTTERRAKTKLQVGVDIPSPDEIRKFLTSLSGRWRPMLVTAVFTGMRSSELRGLVWDNVDLTAKTIRISQRADDFNEIGRPKSAAGNRAISIPPVVVNTLREWKLVCPRRDTGRKDGDGNPMLALDLVFPTGAGKIESRSNMLKRGLIPAMIAAGITVDTGRTDEEGKPILSAKYSGLHALRHFYASWCINPTDAGGLGLSPKAVQDRLGHSTIAMTMDTYGHLFPRGDEGDLLAAAERSLLA